MDPTCCNNLPKSTYDNELLLYLANVLRIFLLYLCHLHPDGEIACRSPQTLRILPLHYLLPICQRDSIAKFFNNFHSYPPIETSSDYQDINTTYQYYVSTTVLTLFYQCSIAQQHMSSICCIITHHPASSPKEKEQGRK